MQFTDLGLADALLRAINEQGYTSPTPIQAKAIPAVMAGGDLLGGAQTGTGKTAAFTLPLLQHLITQPSKKPSGHPIRALVLTPTRELAAQVEESIRTYGKHTQINSMVMFGGVGINPQIKQLRGRVDVLVATPGRLLDHVSQKTLDLSHLEVFVLDEADRMLDMGFIHDVKRVIKLLPPQRQNLLFSATFSAEIQTLAKGLLNNPQVIQVTPENTTVERITQVVHPVDRERKRELLSKLIKDGNWHQVLVFTRTKHGANRLAEQLGKDGITAMAIHGNKSQTARTAALANFKNNKIQVLVATDIAARGIDIDQLPHVVNFELPHVQEDYVHRIGRTGRAGANGGAVSLVCVDEIKLLHAIERFTKQDIPSVIIDGFTPDPSIKAEPIINGRQGAGRGGSGKPQTQRNRPAGGAPANKPRAPQTKPTGAVQHRSGNRHK